MLNVDGKDLVAIAAIAINGWLISQGKDGALVALMSTVIGWYFGTKTAQKAQKT